MIAECCKAILEKVKADTKVEPALQAKSHTFIESRAQKKKTDEGEKGR